MRSPTLCSRTLRWLALFASLCAFALARGAEVIPPAPANHFNDYAGMVSPADAQRLNQELADFERQTSNQLVVVIYPKMQSDSSVEDYAVRVAQKWGVGQKDRKNGAVLFVFQQSHDLWIATGYGLEGALPDALCKRIIEDEIVPRFRAGDFVGGLNAGVHAMMAATKGEYHGTGRTHQESSSSQPGGTVGGVILFIVFILVGVGSQFFRRGHVYGRRGRRAMWLGGPWGGPWGGGSSGSGWGGGGWSGGGGGTFSGGGGSFGGGGAGGKW